VNLTYLSPLENHLWQSTLFAALAGLLTLALRNNHARLRHWVWLAASCKFLIPCSLLIGLGGQVRWRIAPAETTQSNLIVVMDQVSQPFTDPAFSLPLSPMIPPAGSPLPSILLGTWLCGFLGITSAWWVRWRRIRATVHAGSSVDLDLPIRAMSSPSLLEPGVFGVFRPVLLLPEGIFDRLTPAQLKAVIAHELCHVRHRDNLIAAIQMFVETAFWFHPMVWWIGRRMVEERERACDEEVLRLGSEPRVYAEGILSVCRLYVESPLVCVAGITGANLKRRIEAIMANREEQRLNRAKRFLLASAGIAAVAVPLVIGIGHAPPISAQSRVTEKPLAFDAASIKPMNNSGGSVRSEPGLRFLPGTVASLPAGVTARQIITEAYGLTEYQLAGGPGWVGSDRFTLQAKTEAPANRNQIRLMLQTLLTERFKFVASHGTKEMQVYALMVRKGGPGPTRYQAKEGADSPGPAGFQKADAEFARHTGGRASAFTGTTMELFARSLSELRGAQPGSPLLGRPVVDKTGLQGLFNFRLAWNDDDDFMPALQDELGLRLESQKAPMDILVISQIEKPSAN